MGDEGIEPRRPLRRRVPSITGVRMSEMRELEAIASGSRPDLPIILITGDDVAQREARVRRAGGPSRILFRKPFDGQELLATIEASLRNRPDPGA
jgi:DNA-binding response OmpR family regulator